MDAVKIIHRRTFPGGSILELEFLDMNPEAEPIHRFQWYLMLSNIRYALTLIKVVGDHCHLAYGGMVVILNLNANTLKVGNAFYLLE